MKRLLSIAVLLCCPISAALVASEVFAASNKQTPPAGSFPGAPSEFTRFSPAELQRGFLALAFGSDLRIGARPRGIRRFDHSIVARIVQSGSVDRTAAMTRIIEEYARTVPNLHLSVTAANAPEIDMEIRLIDEKSFKSALRAAFGDAVTKEFVARTDPQCMTSVKSSSEGEILRSISFIIVDKGDRIFLDCAYHELLHAFGLSNHDQRNPWTTLNQRRLVGYLTVYDRALLTALYDPRIKPGMTAAQAKSVLPAVFGDLGFGPQNR
jgi:transposase